jgi:hypothetical protein
MPDKREERKAGESLTEYITRLETLSGTRKVRVHPDYIGEGGDLLVKPVVTYSVNSVGTPHPAITTDGGQPLPDEDHVFVGIPATVATQATLRPTSPSIFYVYALWLVQGATAAGRDWTVQLTDGTTSMSIVAAQNVATGATVQLWPRKEADNAFYTAPNFPISNAYYLDFLDTMAAAETATVYAAYVARSAEL